MRKVFGALNHMVLYLGQELQLQYPTNQIKTQVAMLDLMIITRFLKQQMGSLY